MLHAGICGAHRRASGTSDLVGPVFGVELVLTPYKTSPREELMAVAHPFAATAGSLLLVGS
jgi:hypothetical protein